MTRIRRHSVSRPLLGGLIALSAIVTLLPAEAPARTRAGRYDRSGINGSEQAAVRPVTLGVRAGLVGAVPGSASHEAWAVGRSTAKVPGWAGDHGGGQTVFLRYTRSTGWRLLGPPRSAGGTPINPTITALSLAPGGAGWAVGGGGTMLRLSGGTWIEAARVTDASLSSVSITSAGGRTIGFAIGGGPTVLRLDGDRWLPDPLGIAADDIDLRSVSVVSAQQAWIAGRVGRAALIARRGDTGWTRVMTGREMFDGEATRVVGTTIVATTPANTVAASAAGAWIGGAIVPVDAATAQASAAGDPTRPFALFVGRDGRITSFCPDRYAMGSDGRAQTSALCDEPFPLAAFGISAMHVFPGAGRGEVFAGGLGLFHYRDGAWFREPDPVSYVSSMGFVNRTEGWFAGTGGTTAATGSLSTLHTLAHWTRTPATPRMARHPQPMTDSFTGVSHPVEAVAISPDGSGEALAVGRAGAMLRHAPRVGWDTFTPVTAQSLHAVAYRSAREAWAVGGRGFLASYRDGIWRQYGTDAVSMTTASLFGVAFDGEARGYAVGSNGTILTYDGRRWRHDAASRRVTDADLYAIARAGREFVAVGADGTVLETRGRTWRRAPGVGPLVDRGGLLPALYTVAGLPDGTAVAGGELSTLIRRDRATGAWRIERQGSRVPPEGTILALAARRAGGGLDLIVSLAQDPLKYAGEIPAATKGVVLYGTSDGWRDLDGRSRETIFDSFDASATRDPVLSVAFDGSGAWAVGGIGPGNDDGQGHIQGYPTSSIYRIEPSGDPRPTGFRASPRLDASSNLISFAFFGESSCGRGLCSAAVGTGTMADVISSQIRDEINGMAALPGGPTFAVFGGNMRRSGIPEELGQFKHYAKGFKVPLFATLGGNDLFTGIEAPGVLPEQVSPDHSFYIDTFKDRPAPWGEAKPLPGFIPVLDDPSVSGARTHYAFDYAPGGERRLRVIMLDDSAPARLSTAATQNPPRDQNTWLTDALRDARDRNLPAIIVMNRPARNPLDLSNPETSYDEALPVQAAAANVGASAVLTSYFKENAVLMVSVGDSGTVPVYVFGGGGAPLETKPNDSPPVAPEPAQGYYHSWQLVTVDLSRRTSLGQADVSVQSFPVVDGLALHAIDGVNVPGGNTLRFTSSGRTPEGGGPADPLQSRAAVIPMDFRTRGVCAPDASRSFRPRCRSTGPVGPAFRYESEDPSVGYFVTPSAASDRTPALDPTTGLPIPDPSSGLFCAVGGGTTYVSVISGFHRARMQVTVTSGEGPCTKKRIFVPEVVPPEPPVFVSQPEAAVPVKAFGFQFAPEQQTTVVLPPPPITVAAPAPPGAGGYAKKEEHESAPEQATDDHAFTALPRRARAERDAQQAWTILGGAIMLSFWSAAAAAAVYRRRSMARPEESRR
ncbi:MAG TPA: hypothetical protein VM841_06830 [Actinomycetota bacterium]|nr:hypothetical protein [Actinomycetota bacterium]